MEQAVEYLEPLLKEGGTNEKMPTIIIATVEGDIHDIGKNLVKVMIGGAVTTQSFADEIGADGYSKDAADAVRLAKKLLSE